MSSFKSPETFKFNFCHFLPFSATPYLCQPVFTGCNRRHKLFLPAAANPGMEALFFECQLSTFMAFNVGQIYNPPSMDSTLFVDELNVSLEKTKLFFCVGILI